MTESSDLQDSIKMRLTPRSENYLMTISRWSKFIAIIIITVGFVFFISSFVVGALSRTLTASVPFLDGAAVLIISITYIVCALIYFLLGFYLYRFGDKIKQGLIRRQEEFVEQAFHAMKMHYSIMGVLTIITVSLFILMIGIAVFAKLMLI